MDLAALLDPATSAVVTQECMVGVIGTKPVLPALAEVARDTVIPNGARLLDAARAAGVPVVHAVFARRADGQGASTNARLFGALKNSPLVAGAAEVGVVPEMLDERDIVLSRGHGLGPMWGTDLDPVLRNLGVRTVVAIGVSVNIGLTNLVLDAVNAGYQVVVPRDAVAGVPMSYAADVLANTLSLVATLTATDDVVAVWKS